MRRAKVKSPHPRKVNNPLVVWLNKIAMPKIKGRTKLVCEVAQELGVDPGTPYKWMRTTEPDLPSRVHVSQIARFRKIAEPDFDPQHYSFTDMMAAGFFTATESAELDELKAHCAIELKHSKTDAPFMIIRGSATRHVFTVPVRTLLKLLTRMQEG